VRFRALRCGITPDQPRHVADLIGDTGSWSKQFTVTQEFAAGPDRLWAALGRREHARQKYLALGVTAV
jgi:hypothetical protein